MALSIVNRIRDFVEAFATPLFENVGVDELELWEDIASKVEFTTCTETMEPLVTVP